MDKINFDSKLDLKFERRVELSAPLIWEAWTQPELLKQGFCPAPWKTVEAEIDLKPSAILQLETQGTGTLYTAIVIHQDEKKKKAHEAMNFTEGWGKRWTNRWRS